MRPLLLLLPALLWTPPAAMALGQPQSACVLNTSSATLSARTHLLAADGHEIAPAGWQQFFPMMQLCRPLQGAASVRFEITGIPLLPGAVPLLLCQVTASQPNGHVLLVVSPSDGGPRCALR